jgi:hypothetical protein
MSAIFDNKVAGVDEIDDLLDTIVRAIRPSLVVGSLG